MKTCIIIPCYNESKRINTEEFIRFIRTNMHTFLFVDDGSTDNTLEVLGKIKSTCHDKVIITSVPENRGKAEAVRFGMQKALENKTFDHLAYLDSDLATPLDEMSNIIDYINTNDQYHMVMAIRLKRLGSQTNRSLKRHYLGRIFATMVSILLKLPTYDTQCGAKVLKRELAENLFQEPFVSPWFFDVELLFRIKKVRGIEFALHNVYEYPLLVWNEIWGSKIGFLNYFQAPFQLLRIWWIYK